VIFRRLLRLLTVLATTAFGGLALAQGGPGAGGGVTEADVCKAVHAELQQDTERRRASLNAALAARYGVTWQERCLRSQDYFKAVKLLALHAFENHSACGLPPAAVMEVKGLQGASMQETVQICKRTRERP
jgi:hypothetical protein